MDEVELLQKEVLATQVRVRSHEAGGSGTVLYCRKLGDGMFSIFVLTCHHVVEKNIKVKVEFDTRRGRDVKKDYREACSVEFFRYQPSGRVDGVESRQGDIMAYDQYHDMALLRVLSVAEPTGIARLLPKGKWDGVRVGEATLAAGCQLGHDPIITTGGVIAHKRTMIEHKEYSLSTAATVFGSSGGAVFLAKTREFIGIPSRISIVGWSAPVYHMGYFSPVSRVFEFLDEQMFRFIYDAKHTEECCQKERDEFRRKEQERLDRQLPEARAQETPADKDPQATIKHNAP